MKRFSYYFAIIATAILFLQQGCTSNQNKEQNAGATDQENGRIGFPHNPGGVARGYAW